MINVELKPEDVNKAIAEAVLKSSIGRIVSESIESATKTTLAGTGYSVIREKVYSIIGEVIGQEVEKQREMIRKAVEEQVTEDLIKMVFEEFKERLKRRF